ncbi:MAG: hypothetical protein ABGY75_04265 [Gemmataceae bacterium]
MARSHCPSCFTPLEARDTTPCFVCGGWLDSVVRFDATATYTEFRLPSGHTIILCRGCELEEFMVPGGWGYRLTPGAGLPADALQRVRAVDAPRIGRDKFCPSCNLRLAFMSVLLHHPPDAPADQTA